MKLGRYLEYLFLNIVTWSVLLLWRHCWHCSDIDVIISKVQTRLVKKTEIKCKLLVIKKCLATQIDMVAAQLRNNNRKK